MLFKERWIAAGVVGVFLAGGLWLLSLLGIPALEAGVFVGLDKGLNAYGEPEPSYDQAKQHQTAAGLQ